MAARPIINSEQLALAYELRCEYNMTWGKISRLLGVHEDNIRASVGRAIKRGLK